MQVIWVKASGIFFWCSLLYLTKQRQIPEQRVPPFFFNMPDACMGNLEASYLRQSYFPKPIKKCHDMKQHDVSRTIPNLQEARVPRLEAKASTDHSAHTCSNFAENRGKAPTCARHQPRVNSAAEPRPVIAGQLGRQRQQIPGETNLCLLTRVRSHGFRCGGSGVPGWLGQ